MRKRPVYLAIFAFVASIVLYLFVFQDYTPPTTTEQMQFKKKVILQWTPIFGEYKTEALNACPLKDKCEFFIDKSVIKHADAVIFHDIIGELPKKAFDKQKFVIYTMESALNVMGSWSKLPDNYIDWVMSHVSSSDIHSPYGGYWVNPKIAKENGFPSINLPSDEKTILSTKKIKGALWVVSNCKTLS
uniref:Fucosyltransferase N-terminal domain-containing protein n=1 Tax=Panagrolaimus sp. JU765 TaxID=591449 RepID=A0AC34Q190_9BILA